MTAATASATGRAVLEAIRDRILDPPPAARLLRLDLEEVGDGTTVFGFTADDAFANPTVVHGGILAAIADFAATTAVWTQAPLDADILTADLHVTYLRSLPLDGNRYRCRGSVVYSGRSQANASVSLTSAAGTTHVVGLATCRIRNRTLPSPLTEPFNQRKPT